MITNQENPLSPEQEAAALQIIKAVLESEQPESPRQTYEADWRGYVSPGYDDNRTSLPTIIREKLLAQGIELTQNQFLSLYVDEVWAFFGRRATVTE
jgi:hypothetical protein